MTHVLEMNCVELQKHFGLKPFSKDEPYCIAFVSNCCPDVVLGLYSTSTDESPFGESLVQFNVLTLKMWLRADPARVTAQMLCDLERVGMKVHHALVEQLEKEHVEGWEKFITSFSKEMF